MEAPGDTAYESGLFLDGFLSSFNIAESKKGLGWREEHRFHNDEK